jgi:uncharacterized protein (TIGR03437 family)
MKLVRALLLLSVAGLFLRPGAAQTFDSSGNGLLNGTYYFRQVYYIFDSSGNFTDATTLYGNISFDGNGKYTISGNKIDAATNTAPVAYSASGTYTVSASGMGYIDNPLYPGDEIYGLVSKSIFVGSSTETVQPYNDLFIAAPIGSAQATNATLNGTYSVAYEDASNALDATFVFNSTGAGSIGNISASGWYLDPNFGPTPVSQNLSGTHYTFTNGAANVTFGGSQTLLPSGVLLYISPDGNFIFGGTFNGFDMYVGVRVTSGTPTFNGLYYEAGIDFDGSSTFDTYYGAFDALSGNTLEHRRIYAGDYTYADPYTLNSNGSYYDTYNSQHYVFGLNGALRIGFGTSEGAYSPLLGLSVALKSPSFSGPDVYLNPIGVVNAASSAPFTAGISPGELITLYGTGLAPNDQAIDAASIPLNKQLNGVSVEINGEAAPVISVSSTQVSVVVPFDTGSSGYVANIQVMNNGVSSNTVSEFINPTSAGVFTNPEGGLGQAAALHTDYSLISPSSPAQIGETIQVFLTGLGAVSPGIDDGAAGSASNLTTNQITAYVDGTQATVTYAGLAPGFAGLYQVLPPAAIIWTSPIRITTRILPRR